MNNQTKHNTNNPVEKTSLFKKINRYMESNKHNNSIQHETLCDDNYFKSLTNKIADSLPMTYQFLRNSWSEIAKDYISTHPLNPTHNIQTIEQDFFGWIQKPNMHIGECLSEVIRFEVQLQQCLQQNIRTGNTIRNKTKLVFNENVLLSKFNYPVNDIHCKFQEKLVIIKSKLTIRDILLKQLLQTPKEVTCLLIMKEYFSQKNKKTKVICINTSTKRFIKLLQQQSLKASIERILKQYPNFDVNTTVDFLLKHKIII